MQGQVPVDAIRQIYGHLADRESKEIYKARLLFSLTGDYGEIVHIVAGTQEAMEIRRQAAGYPGTPVYMWGTGFWAGYLRRAFPEMNWRGYVDNCRKESRKDGLPVLCAEEFREKCPGALVLIATTDWHREIYRQLLSYGWEPGKIINAGKRMQGLFEKQYFDLPCMPHVEDEVFVDAGCFDGLSVKGFLQWSGGEYREIMAFEPDKLCCRACRDVLGGVPGLSLVPKGLWGREQALSFHETGNSDSTVMEGGETQIEAVRLDDALGGRKATFIKMDIEGAEKEALSGAAGTIREHKPKLAVSIYHRPEDIWELPRLVLEMRPDYRLYLRHYSLRDAETVLYAI